MAKSIDELEKTACKYWPTDIVENAAKTNPIPLLLKTQDVFISILKCASASPSAWQTVLNSSSISPNLFLKHLSVLTDIGGERLQRFSKDFKSLFPNQEIVFTWNNSNYKYHFHSISPRWDNSKLKIDKANLVEHSSLTNEMCDVIMLLLFGGLAIAPASLPEEIYEKCIIGQLIGKTDELDEFVKQRYICVSKITAGSTANDCGHVCEDSCVSRLKKLLPSNFVIGGHTIEGVSQNDKDLTTFDMVVRDTHSHKCCAIEISFQVTTNSVIERKSLLARERQQLLHSHGHAVAYIIDGSGNFQRKNAVSTILNFSDCSVNFSDAGLQELANFIKNM